MIAPEGDGRWTEYAGGYSDMLAQRGADLSRAPAAKAASEASARSRAAPAAPATAPSAS